MKPEIILPGPDCKIIITEALFSIEFKKILELKRRGVVLNISGTVEKNSTIDEEKAAVLMSLHL